MKVVYLRAILFVVTCLLGAFLMWLGGYDFETRNPLVAYGALLIMFLAAWMASFPSNK